MTQLENVAKIMLVIEYALFYIFTLTVQSVRSEKSRLLVLSGLYF